MIAIVNVNDKWGIGRNNGLLVDLKGDMKFFRDKTKDSVIIVGLNTLNSFPGSKPLRGRVNVVLTDSLDKIKPESIAAADAYISDQSDIESVTKLAEVIEKPGSTALIATDSVHDLLELVSCFDGDSVFVCGGASVYKLMLPYCDTCLVTKNDCGLEADVFFPDLDNDPEWTQTACSDVHEENGTKYCFTTYERKSLNMSDLTVG